MKSAKLWLLVAFVLLSLTTPASTRASENITVTRDIRYGPDPLQSLDIYQPARCVTQPCPVVMWVHGGGWQRGDASQRRSTEMQSLWAGQGIVMIGVNYRLSPAVMHPAHVQDIAAAIHWVHTNIAAHGGDRRRLSLLGHSAGAHLVALVATNPSYLARHNLEPGRDLAHVFPIDTASFDLMDSSLFVDRLVEQAFGTDPAMLRDASPIWQIREGGSYPAFYIAAVKVRDDAVSTSQIMVDKLRDVGATADLLIMDYPGARQLKAHGMIAADLANLDSAMTKTLIARVLRP